MKKHALTFLCLAGLTLSAVAQDKPVDNSAQNQQDRSGDTKTSGDQSESSSDIKITAAIRRAIMKDDSLSMTAKNVKIITEKGMVTLRGPVNTAAEKTTIARLAGEAAPQSRVDDQLEVIKSK